MTPTRLRECLDMLHWWLRWPRDFGSPALCVDRNVMALMFGEGEMPHH